MPLDATSLYSEDDGLWHTKAQEDWLERKIGAMFALAWSFEREIRQGMC